MHIHEIMTKDVGGLVPESTLKEAAHKMDSLGVGFLPVCDGDKLVGVLTDRDIVVRGIAKGRDPATATVEDIMTREVISVPEASTINEAITAMRKKQIRRLVVIDEDELICGVVSIGDIAVYAGGSTAAARALEEVCRPAQPRRGV